MHGLGGMEIVAWDLACEFARAGHSVRVITTALPDKSEKFEQDGVTVIALEQARARRYSISWWLSSRRYFQQNCMQSAGVVLSVSMAALAILSLKNSLPGVKFIMQAHGTSWGEITSKWRSKRIKSIIALFKNFIWLLVDAVAYNKFDKVIAIGEKVHDDLTRSSVSWCLPFDKVELIENGIDTKIFQPLSASSRSAVRLELNISENSPVIISVGRLHLQKGMANTLEAFAQLQSLVPESVLLIVGDGPERNKLELACEALKIKGKVFFLGVASRTNVARFLQAADAFVFMTEHVEGLPLNVLEAYACGLPMVLSEHLKHLPTANTYYASPKSYFDICTKLKSCLLEFEDAHSVHSFPERWTLSYSAQQYLKAFEYNFDK